MSDVRHWFHLLLICLPVLLSACPLGSGPKTFPVNGKVTFHGTPLEAGVVTFHPLGAGNPSSASIDGGNFRLTGDAGLPPGQYRVEIISNVKTGKKIPGIGPDGQADEIRQVIPDRYNRSSELSIEIPASDGHGFQFDLQEH